MEDGLDDIYQRLQTTQESFLRARSPTMTLLDQVYERFVGRDYNNKDVWQTLKANPTFLTTIPTNKQWTILHHIVQQVSGGGLRHSMEEEEVQEEVRSGRSKLCCQSSALSIYQYGCPSLGLCKHPNQQL